MAGADSEHQPRFSASVAGGLAAEDPALAEAAREGDAGEEVAVIVRLSAPAALPGDVRTVTRFGNIATLRLKRSRITEVEGSDAVGALEAARRLGRVDGPEPGLEDDVEPGALASDTRRPEGLEETGRGVVVAVLDWGCDFAHPAFRNEDGSTRLLALWDQRPAGVSGTSNPWGYGRLFTRADIDAALGTGDPYGALDYDPSAGQPDGAHGTHVLDIAAGNGRGGGPAGVAPEADLVFVHLARTAEVLGSDNLGDSASVLEALDFVFSVANDLPCVVNMSVGAHGGPHDGSTLVEQGIDQALALEPGRAVVCSAGNYFGGRAHAEGRLRPGGEQRLRFRVPEGDPTESEIEVWYPGVDRITIELFDPDGVRLCRVAPGQDARLFRAGEAIGHVYHHLRHSTNGDHHADVFLEPGAPGGVYELALRADQIEDGRFHAWVERDRGLRPTFEPEHVSPTLTTGTLCNGRLSITVGAYDARSDARPLGSFSSAGPTRDGRVKPECVAPGLCVCAARSAPSGAPPGARYIRRTGTSMAAPHVTGAAALMFQAAGRRLAISDLRALLFASCERHTAELLAEDLHRSGYGYLDVVRAARAAARFHPPSTGDDAPAADRVGFPLELFRGDAAPLPGLPPTPADEARDSERAPWKGPSMASPRISSEQIRQHLRSLSPELIEEVSTLEPPATLLRHPVGPGDVIVRRSPGEGVEYTGIVVSERPENAADLALRGVPTEAAGPGTYVEVLEVPFGGHTPRAVGRRLTDAYGRLPHGQSVARRMHGTEATPAEHTEDTHAETVDVDDVASEMNGLRARFEVMYTARGAGGTSRTFHDGATLTIDDWNGTGTEAVIATFNVPKIVLSPFTDRGAGVRLYVVALAAQRQAILDNARRLREWLATTPGRDRTRWDREKQRLEDLLARRQTTYSRMWVRQMMYNRFDHSIAYWTAHYNTTLRPADPLDPNVVKSMLYQESRMGTSGRHLMPPPSDWSSRDRHPIRSRFNIGQAIDSWGPQQWLMMREMAPAIFTRHGLDALGPHAAWLGMSNSQYSAHPTFMTALREFFEHRSGGVNLMGSVGRDLHEDYGFWIRAAIRWLFQKYQSLRSPSWREAVRAYNGSGARARTYRDEVLARVGSLEAFSAEAEERVTPMQELMAGPSETAPPHDIELPPLVLDEEPGATSDDAREFEEVSPIWGAEAHAFEEYADDRAPSLDGSATLEWVDLTRVNDSSGNPQVFCVVTGAPPGPPTVTGDEGKAVFHLKVRNTNSVYNHQDVVTKTRVLDVLPRRQFRVVRDWSSQRGQELEDESSRIIPLRLSAATLEAAYNPDSPLTRLEVEYHWREAGEGSQQHYNRTGLDFVLVAPIEFLLSRRRRLHPNDHELNDPRQHKDDFWIPVTGVRFTEDLRQPVTIELEVNASVTRQASAQQQSSTSQSTSTTRTHTTSSTFSLQLSGEASRTGSVSGTVEIFELGLQQMFKLGGSLGYSRTTTDTSSTTVAREFSRSLALSRSYGQSQGTSTRTTVTISPPSTPGPSGTGTRTSPPPPAAATGSVGVYLYPVVAFFEVPYVRFDSINRFGQATRRSDGRVAVPYVTGWRLTSHRGA